MADNLSVTPGTGATAGAYDAGSGVLVQRIHSDARLIDVTLTLDTSAYASGDVIAETQVVAACCLKDDVPAVLTSVVLIDEDDQAVDLTLLFFSGSGSLGSENSAPSISDTNIRQYLGRIEISTSDYIDLGGASVASISELSLVVKPATGTDDIYVGVLNGTGTPTYTASGLKLRLGFV